MGQRLILLLSFSLLGIGCKDDDCPNPLPETQYLLIDTAGHWFENMIPNPVLSSFSNNGKSESYDTYLYQEIKSTGIENCTLIKKEIRTLSFISSLYQRRFEFVIRRELGNDILRIDGYYFASRFIEMNIQSPQSCVIHFLDQIQKEHLIALPVTKIDSVVVKTKTYRNVLKIDLMDPLYSFDKKTAVLYFTSRNGLIAFETFDGETWYLY